MFKRALSLTVIVCFLLTTLGPLPKAHADTILDLPLPGTMVNLSPAYEPVIIKGLTIHKDNPFLFDFIVDVGQDNMSGESLKKEGEKLIKYFLASLAIPDKDLWVNLSPYEKNKMVPEALGQTDMGRDLLEQDYILKQITASLIYPEKQLGKTFWDKVYAKAQEMYGTTQVPVNTFNKVWIMADRAEVFEHNQTAFVVDQHLKVMLEEDYLALSKHQRQPGDMFNKEQQKNVSPSTLPSELGLNLKATQGQPGHALASQIVREIILPELEKEVNTGKNFANLRQIFNSIILSSWYKKNLKEALLNQVYANKSNVNGVIASGAKQSREEIYEQYLKAYKKGVFNYIKEESLPPFDGEGKGGVIIPRKYFSGGFREGAAAKPTITTNEEILANSLPDRAMFSIQTGVLPNPKIMPTSALSMSKNIFQQLLEIVDQMDKDKKKGNVLESANLNIKFNVLLDKMGAKDVLDHIITILNTTINGNTSYALAKLLNVSEKDPRLTILLGKWSEHGANLKYEDRYILGLAALLANYRPEPTIIFHHYSYRPAFESSEFSEKDVFAVMDIIERGLLKARKSRIKGYISANIKESVNSNSHFIHYMSISRALNSETPPELALKIFNEGRINILESKRNDYLKWLRKKREDYKRVRFTLGYLGPDFQDKLIQEINKISAQNEDWSLRLAMVMKNGRLVDQVTIRRGYVPELVKLLEEKDGLKSVAESIAKQYFFDAAMMGQALKDFYYRARQNAHKRITGRSWIPGDTSGDVVRLYDKVLSMGYPTVELSKIDKNRARKISSQINEAVEQLRKMLDFDGRVVAPSSLEEIKASLVNTSVFHPALFEKSTLEQFGLGDDISPTFVFDGSIFKKPNGLKQPYRIVVDLGEDITTVIVTYSYLDKYSSFKEAWSKDGLLTPDFEVEHFLVSKGGFRIIKLGKIDEGNDFDGSFEDKIEGKNTKALLPEADDLAHGMGNKGPTIGASKEGGKATAVLKRGGDLKRGIKDWVTSSILANFLGIEYLTGPDMGSGDYMGVVQEQADLVHKTLGLPLIPVTTSIAGQSSSFDHMQWRVTSISAWTTFLVLWQNPWIRKRYGLTDHVDIVIQGFGDVGSGLVQLIHDLYKDLPGWLDGDNPIIRVTSVSDINGGIDNPKGLGIGALLRLRKRLMQKESISLKRDYSSESNGEFQTFDDGKHVFYVHTPAKGEEKRSVIAFPAAGPAVFTTKEDIMRLKAAGVDMVVSPGNNTVKAGLEKDFEESNILLLGSDESSGGGIKTSDEELTHKSIDGGVDSLERKVDREPKEWESHITKNIEWVQTSLIKREQELFEREIRKGHIVTFHDIHTDLAAQIRNNKNNILASPDRPFRESVVKEVEAVLVHEYGFTPSDAKLPSKLKDSIAIAVILYRTIELARVRAIYGEGLARNARALKHMATLDNMLSHPEMEAGTEEQNAIYELGKMGWGEARENILKIIKNKKFENVRDVSVASLNDLGRPGDLPLLHELANDPNPSVRFAAKEAAKWIENNLNGNGVRPAQEKSGVDGILNDYLTGIIQRGAAMDLLMNGGLSMEDSGRYLDKAHEDFTKRERIRGGREVNLAMISGNQEPFQTDFKKGGIDLNTSNGMQWKVSKDGHGVEMSIDPAMLERIRREGINSLSPVIFRITPIASIWPLIGLQAPIK